MKYKKGSGLPMNIIIISIIGLVVLAVVVAIFSGKASMFKSEAEKTKDTAVSNVCMKAGGQCIPKEESICIYPEGKTINSLWLDCDADQHSHRRDGAVLRPALRILRGAHTLPG